MTKGYPSWWSMLKGLSGQVFHFWPKCWEQPKMHSYQIWTFYVYPFSRYCSSKLTILLLLQCCHFVSMWQKINFWKVGLNLLEKQLIYNSDPLLCPDNDAAEITYWELRICSNFLKSCLQLATLPTFWEEKTFLRENVNCYIFGTEGRWKLKFGQVFRFVKIFWDKTDQNFFSTWMLFWY